LTKVYFSRCQDEFFIVRHSAVLLEGVARAVESGEPVLLVGETGVGKTASVQFLAQQTGRSDSTYVSDLDPHGSH
jgi:midasin